MKRNTKITLFMTMVFIIVLFLSITYVGSMGHIHNSIVGCDGIERFYTSTGFWNDADSIITTSIVNNSIKGKTFNVLPPSKFQKGYEYDCKSITNALYCLSELYNETCKFQQTLRFYEGYEGMIGHIGLVCFNRNYGGWATVF